LHFALFILHFALDLSKGARFPETRSMSTKRSASRMIHLAVWSGLIAFVGWVWVRSERVGEPDWSSLGISLAKDQVYRTDGSLRLDLDLYVPVSPAARPRHVVIMLHGGSWIGGTKAHYRRDPRNLVIRLATQGIVVAAVDYRLARPGEPTWPAVLDDVREAVRWVRRNADRLKIDADRIVLIGQSAGAHLAMLIATNPVELSTDGVSARVQGVVSFYGATDLNRLVEFRQLEHDPVRTFLGGSSAEFVRKANDASPLNHVSPDDPPMLLLHGSDDLWVPPEQSNLMAEALGRAGVANRLILVDGARHGFETLFEPPLPRDLLPEILAFVESVWNVSLVAPRSASVETVKFRPGSRFE
jgi:acetyl esterase/lipase